MTSVVIAAHNEESVIGRCLEALAAQSVAADLDVIVAANGCTDGTVEIARRYGVQVVETGLPGKAQALNLGESVARDFPRVYLDADITLEPRVIESLVAALQADSSLCAAVPTRRVDTSGSPWPVRSYTAISNRLPAFAGGLFGRGVIALSARGRSRFTTFPVVTADDLFLDSLFSADEKIVVGSVAVWVKSPRRTRDLLRRLTRVRRANGQLRRTGREARSGTIRPADRMAWLTEVVLREPRLAPAGLVYAALTLAAAALARRATDGSHQWERDESTRGWSAGPGDREVRES